MLPAYPILAGEIAKRGIKRTSIARRIGVSPRSFQNRMSGMVSFSWDEACEIKECFFPDLDLETLFKKNDAI